MPHVGRPLAGPSVLKIQAILKGRRVERLGAHVS